MRKHVRRGILLMAGVAVVSMPVTSQAQDPCVGTWRLNLAKSKYEPANLGPKSQTIKQDAVTGGGTKSVVDAVDAQGKTVHQEYTTMFDGKPTDIKGAPDANTTRVYKRIEAGPMNTCSRLVGNRRSPHEPLSQQIVRHARSRRR